MYLGPDKHSMTVSSKWQSVCYLNMYFTASTHIPMYIAAQENLEGYT